MLDFLWMTENVAYQLPAMPRMLAAFAEWNACFLMLLLIRSEHSKRVAAVLLAAALPIQIFLRCFTPEHMENVTFMISMAVNLAFMLETIYAVSGKRAAVVLFAWSMAFLFAELTASIGWQLCACLFDAPSLLQPKVALVLLAFFALADLAGYALLRGFTEEFIAVDWKMTLLSVLVALLTFLTSNIYVVFNQNLWLNANVADVYFTIGWLRALADLCGYSILVVLLSYAQHRHSAEELQRIQSLMDAQYRQYLSFRETSNYISQQCHDLKHQIAALRQSCTEEERLSYCAELENAVERYAAFSNTGNPVLDTLLSQKLAACEQRGIQFSYTVDGALLNGLDVRDICIIFGNLLDNAIESAEQIAQPERRQILLEVSGRLHLVSIRMDNCCDHPVELRGGLPVTTKRDHLRHGYGMKGVACVVEKYDGAMECSQQEGWFVTSILLSLSKTQPLSRSA